MSSSSHSENIPGPSLCQPWGHTLIPPRKEVLGCELKSSSTSCPHGASCLMYYSWVWDASLQMLQMTYIREWFNSWEERRSCDEDTTLSIAAVVMWLDVCSNAGKKKKKKSTHLYGCTVYSTKPHQTLVRSSQIAYDPQKCPGCQACFHLGLDGTSVKLGTAALGLIKSRCEVLAQR